MRRVSIPVGHDLHAFVPQAMGLSAYVEIPPGDYVPRPAVIHGGMMAYALRPIGGFTDYYLYPGAARRLGIC